VGANAPRDKQAGKSLFFPVHTADSWARAIAAAALEVAQEDAAMGNAAVSVPAKIVVERVPASPVTDEIPPIFQICLVTEHHHVCWGIFGH
jgi:hypothetical protein